MNSICYILSPQFTHEVPIMTSSAKIVLSVESDKLDSFCNKLIKRSRNIAKTHDALITLETFITLFGQAAHGTNEYKTIETLIKSYTEHTRQQLMAQETRKLISALKHCAPEELATIHTPLSRNGFYEILQVAVIELTAEEIRHARSWASNWITDAKHKAEQASGYPDAMDFKSADISIEEFQAMSDVSRFLKSHTDGTIE